jgi:carbon-monoxide dehydrogenase large subunit
MGVATMVGARIKRREDPRLITGHGTYTDDLHPAGTIYLQVVRSPYAHAIIKSINTEAARKMPGVSLVLTGQELVKYVNPLVAVTSGPWPTAAHNPITPDKVRFVGDIVAAVVADTRGQARDAADAIEVEYEQLPVVIDIEKAFQEGAPLVHDGIPRNLASEQDYGGDTTAAFKAAEVVVEQRFINQRLAPNPMETRTVLADYRMGEDSLTLTTSTQIPHILRTLISGIVNIPEHKVHVVAPEVGGGFGCKLNVYAEEAIACYASKKTGRPVKWVESRSESLSATIHGRDHVDYVKIAAKKDGTILGLEITPN